MILSVIDDLGTLEVRFAGLVCYLCDAASYRCLETIKRYLLRRSELLPLVRFDLDCDLGVCSVYSDDGLQDSCLPVLKFSLKHRLFTEPCFLLSLYNLFASKRARIHI